MDSRSRRVTVGKETAGSSCEAGSWICGWKEVERRFPSPILAVALARALTSAGLLTGRQRDDAEVLKAFSLSLSLNFGQRRRLPSASNLPLILSRPSTASSPSSYHATGDCRPFPSSPIPQPSPSPSAPSSSSARSRLSGPSSSPTSSGSSSTPRRYEEEGRRSG